MLILALNRSYGASGAVQTGCQTGEDSVDRDSQTIPISKRTRWTQHPQTEARASGLDAKDAHHQEKATILVGEGFREDSARFAAFIGRIGPVVEALLAENVTSITPSEREEDAGHSAVAVAEDVRTLRTPRTLFHDRPLVSAVHAASKPQLVLGAYGPAPQQQASARPGMVAVWNSNAPTKPTHVLVTECVPTSCCFSPGKAAIAFVGGADGSLEAWDLREPVELHRRSSKALTESGEVLRSPSYSTTSLGPDVNHVCPVIEIAGVPSGGTSANGTASLTRGDDGGRLPAFQLATLDAAGELRTWTLVELLQTDFAGSVADLGLRPGARITIAPSARVQLCPAGAQAYCLRLFPANPNQVLAGIDTGSIVHGVRFGKL